MDKELYGYNLDGEIYKVNKYYIEMYVWSVSIRNYCFNDYNTGIIILNIPLHLENCKSSSSGHSC